MQREIDLLKGEKHVSDDSDGPVLISPDQGQDILNWTSEEINARDKDSMTWNQIVPSKSSLERSSSECESHSSVNETSRNSNIMISPADSHQSQSLAAQSSIESTRPSISLGGCSLQEGTEVDPTQSQSIGDVTLNGRKIEECFTL